MRLTIKTLQLLKKNVVLPSPSCTPLYYLSHQQSIDPAIRPSQILLQHSFKHVQQPYQQHHL